MEPYKVKLILERGYDLDYCAVEFIKLMTQSDEDQQLGRTPMFSTSQSINGFLVDCHQSQYIVRYVHVLDKGMVANGLFGQFQLFKLDDAHYPTGEKLWSVQFDQHGNTGLGGAAESIIPSSAHTTLPTRNNFKYQIVGAIQDSLEMPEPI